MKLYKILFAMIASVALFASCGSEEYWEAYTPNDTALYSFDQSKATHTFTAANLAESVSVTLTRADASKEVKLPITSDFSSAALSAAQDYVVFAQGSHTASYVITIQKDSFPIGQSEVAKLYLPKGHTSASGKDSIWVTVSVDYTWQPAGSCLFTSEWVENEEPIRVQIEKAAEGENLYRLVNLYQTLSPEAVTEEGYHILFTLDNDHNALALAPNYQLTGEKSDNGDIGIYCNPAHPRYGALCEFTNDDNEFILKCLFTAGGTPRWKKTESFVWDQGYPGSM